jgi:hypothetical protein
MNIFLASTAILSIYSHLLVRLFQDDETVPGTTEGIITMGILIVLIIVIPIVVTRRRWMR